MSIYDEGIVIVSGSASVSLVREFIGSVLGWPTIRPSDYNPAYIYDEDTGTWITADSSGGSRYETKLVVIGQNSVGEGVIYYG